MRAVFSATGSGTGGIPMLSTCETNRHQRSIWIWDFELCHTSKTLVEDKEAIDEEIKGMGMSG